MTGASGEAQRQRLQAILRADATLMRLLVRLRALHLPQWRLVAGCLYQTVWNLLTGRPQGTGIRDYDLIYFDAHDLSWEAEDAVIRRVAAATIGCVGPVQVRNQARVHLWFQDRFGVPYLPLSCADEALLRYASVVHAIGVRLTDADGLDVIAPFGLDDLFAMVIRPNRTLDNAASHARKAARAQALWPEVTVISWNDPAEPASPPRVPDGR
ncbi:MAG TPA: nucleotidyltransferase family protein [Acetobacteraceae bacterium]|nr:nucleotidyltransferase family protein [Acetobacteraceae bacterium]